MLAGPPITALLGPGSTGLFCLPNLLDVDYRPSLTSVNPNSGVGASRRELVHHESHNLATIVSRGCR
jgi:hypothetical protein